MVTLAHLQSSQGYNIQISMCITTRNIHIFKYDNRLCEYDIFEDQESACEFINRPLPRTRFGVNLD